MAEAHREATAAVDGEQNPRAAEGERRICFDFLNLGRCSRARIFTFRHLLPESAEAQADAARRGVRVERLVAAVAAPEPADVLAERRGELGREGEPHPTGGGGPGGAGGTAERGAQGSMPMMSTTVGEDRGSSYPRSGPAA